MTQSAPAWELRNVTKRFPGVLANDRVSLMLHAGRIHGLLGENGCGKSTLIKTVAGVHAPTAGTVEIDGRSVLPLTPGRARELGIQVIVQALSLFPNLTVAENIAIESHLEKVAAPVSYAGMRTLAERVLKRLAFTLDPMMSSVWYDPSADPRTKKGPIWRLVNQFDKFFDWVSSIYTSILKVSLKYRKTTLAIAVKSASSP